MAILIISETKRQRVTVESVTEKHNYFITDFIVKSPDIARQLISVQKLRAALVISVIGDS